MTTYRLRATALCPVDGSRDHYDVEVRSTHRIEAGAMRAFFDRFAILGVFQEEIAAEARLHFGAGVDIKIIGQHPSPVEIVT